MMFWNCFLWVVFLLKTTLGYDEEDAIINNKCSPLHPGCRCYDLGELDEVRCSNASELFGTKYLVDGSIFEVNTTFEITIEGGIRILPPRSLDGLIVFRLTLDNPEIEAVDDKVFDGVLRLRRFHVRQSSIKVVPDFRPVRHSLRNLNLDNSLLTALEGDGLKDLPLLEALSFFNNSIQHVSTDVFEGTNNVIIFDLSYNKLSYLPPHLFDPWKNLRKVALSHNQLIHVDQLFSVARPWFIFMDFNNITDLDSIIYPNMTNLITLLLSNNPIKQVSMNSFIGKLPEIKFLYMDHCQIREFNVLHYQNLSVLNTLDLSYNEIEIIPEQSITFGYSLELVLEGNRIRDFQAEMSFTVKRAYLANNRLRNLGKTLQFTQLTEVSVARNELQQLRTEDFQSVHGLSVLNLHDNQINWIDRLAFSSVRNDLHNLDLSCNRISSLNGSVKFLSQLKYLNLTSNLITAFEDGEFTGLNELSELYLHDNNILALGGQLQQLPQLQFLVLVSNRIQTLKTNQIPKSLQYLYIAENPILCDCNLFPFLQWLNSSRSPHTDVPLCLPSSRNMVKAKNHVCPSRCRCSCTKGAEGYFMSLDCSSANFSVLPLLLINHPSASNTEDSPSVNIYLNRITKASNDNDVEITDTIGGIDLSNNSIETLEDARLPPDLRHLYLHNNLLRELPPILLSDFPKLRQVSLSDNPWSCDCNTVDFRKWILSKEDIIKDANKTRCGATKEAENSNLIGKMIATLDDRDLCPTSIGFFFSLGFGIIAFFLAITITKILYTRYEMYIKVWLYSHGVTWVKEKDIDRDKHFDAFMSFSHQDQDFVINQIISVIETKAPKVRLCLHYKHFMPGEYIHDNIMSAVQSSKRTVLVLSRKFLESEWCLMEFRAAHVQALKDRVHRIVVIKVGELPKEMDPSIKMYLESTTYLTWGEKYFWNNLFYVLPTSDRILTQVTPSYNKAFKEEPI